MMPRRVVLCGAGYGEAYRRVFRPLGAQLIGIVGQGGRRSRCLASAMQVPWSCDVKRFLSEADLVVVAVGGAEGNAIAIECLKHAVPVLKEHPVSSEFVAQAAHAAAGSQVKWLVNPHFAYLPAPAALLARGQELARAGKPHSVSVITNARMAFSAIDLLLRLADACSIDLAAAMITRMEMSVMSTWHHESGTITLEIRRNHALEDNEHDVMAGHRFRVDFPKATLDLKSAAGNLVEIAAAPGARPSEIVPCQTRRRFLENREFANLLAVRSMLTLLPEQPDWLKEQEYAARTARIWEEVLRLKDPSA